MSRVLGRLGPRALRLRAVGSIAEGAASAGGGIAREQCSSTASSDTAITAVGTAGAVPTMRLRARRSWQGDTVSSRH